MDGLEIDTSTKDGKALVRMSEIISDVVDYVEDMRLQMDSVTDWLSDLADMSEDADESDYDDVDELCDADTDSGCLESDVDCSECEGCPVKEEPETAVEETAPVEEETETAEEKSDIDEYTEEELSDMLDRYIDEELAAISEADEDDPDETVDDDDDDDTVEEETVSEDDSEPVTETVSETEDEDDEELDMEEEEELYEVTCPSCDETVFVSEETLNAGSMKCPNCGELLEFDYDGMTIEDFED